MSSRKTGNIGEDVACQFLQGKGFRVIKRNYLKPWGEIDIIAEKAGIIHFVEVKAISRESTSEVSREMDHQPEELVDVRKLRKIARTAASYMAETKDDREYQIDVVGVILSHKTRTARCRLVEQAVEDSI
ncbi:YraN family protein [Candidatus Kaiserbacteria bacterium]|nr:YraN family protein [Candidatus Kaiserbacteria bacterium]